MTDRRALVGGLSLSIMILLLCSLLIARASAQLDTECKWRQNISDVEELAHHKYQVLEDCLFYKLSQDADREQGKGNALMMLPPTISSSDILTVDVLDVTVRQMWMNEVWKEMHVNGYMTMSWKDRRLRWDVSDWKTDTLNVKSYGRLWVPDINSDKHQTSMQASDYTTYQNINAKNTGNVTARLEFRMQAQCEIDFTKYPEDDKYCCFTLQSHLYPYYIKYFLAKGERNVDYKNMRTNWDITDVTVKVLPDPDDRKTQTLELCIASSRKSATLRIELTIPMVISAILVLVAPFFGRFQQQLYVKLFAILLQFLCFQYLADKTPQIGFGDTVPNIYKFYEFTLATTVISLLITLIVAAAARVDRKLPPAHRYTLLAAALNTNLCCAADNSDPTENKEGHGNYQRDWMQIHCAINNVLSLFIVIAYFIGVIILSV
uniref:Neurotransmitter-gated ion-channel ligand-binding domain-containing protein n=1 Tax=Plectus sambesii TaxID=2011161 RepID=A0A914UH63_9BILA